MGDFAIVIPLKDFSTAKQRLRAAGIRNTEELVRNLALGVIVASNPKPVVVVTESDEVGLFARENGAEVMFSNAHNLNDAVAFAYHALGPRFEQLMIALGDLARPKGLGAYVPEPGVTIVADHHGQGTNVLVLPTQLDFHFAYGTQSRQRHEAEAQRLGQLWRVESTSPWALDIDEPGDLDVGL